MAIRTKDVEATFRLFRALGDETRLRLIEQLRGGEPEAFATLNQALTELKFRIARRFASPVRASDPARRRPDDRARLVAVASSPRRR